MRYGTGWKFADTGWSEWHSASPQPGDLVIVARGADGFMWERWRVGPVWQSWQVWPQSIFSGAGVPAVSSQGDLRLDTLR